jgi:hypothetical protein
MTSQDAVNFEVIIAKVSQAFQSFVIFSLFVKDSDFLGLKFCQVSDNQIIVEVLER